MSSLQHSISFLRARNEELTLKLRKLDNEHHKILKLASDLQYQNEKQAKTIQAAKEALA